MGIFFKKSEKKMIKLYKSLMFCNLGSVYSMEKEISIKLNNSNNNNFNFINNDDSIFFNNNDFNFLNNDDSNLFNNDDFNLFNNYDFNKDYKYKQNENNLKIEISSNFTNINIDDYKDKIYNEYDNLFKKKLFDENNNNIENKNKENDKIFINKKRKLNEESNEITNTNKISIIKKINKSQLLEDNKNNINESLNYPKKHIEFKEEEDFNNKNTINLNEEDMNDYEKYDISFLDKKSEEENISILIKDLNNFFYNRLLIYRKDLKDFKDLYQNIFSNDFKNIITNSTNIKNFKIKDFLKVDINNESFKNYKTQINHINNINFVDIFYNYLRTGLPRNNDEIKYVRTDKKNIFNIYKVTKFRDKKNIFNIFNIHKDKIFIDNIIIDEIYRYEIFRDKIFRTANREKTILKKLLNETNELDIEKTKSYVKLLLVIYNNLKKENNDNYYDKNLIKVLNEKLYSRLKMIYNVNNTTYRVDNIRPKISRFVIKFLIKYLNESIKKDINENKQNIIDKNNNIEFINLPDIFKNFRIDDYKDFINKKIKNIIRLYFKNVKNIGETDNNNKNSDTINLITSQEAFYENTYKVLNMNYSNFYNEIFSPLLKKYINLKKEYILKNNLYDNNDKNIKCTENDKEILNYVNIFEKFLPIKYFIEINGKMAIDKYLKRAVNRYLDIILNDNKKII